MLLVSLFTLDAPRAKFPVCEYVYYNSILFDKQLDIDILDTTKDLFILAFHNLYILPNPILDR